MSRRVFTIDKTLHEILSRSFSDGFTLNELRVEFSSRSTEEQLPPNKDLFWMIFMQIYALKGLNLVFRYEKPGGGGIFVRNKDFEEYPFNVVNQLFVNRWFGDSGPGA
jgi:hypothetical protein